MKKPAKQSAKKAAKPAVQSKKPVPTSPTSAKKPAPSKPAAPAAPNVQPYTPGPIQGIGWKPFRYPPE